MNLLFLFLILVFAHAVISRRLERSLVTAPILFAAAGLLVAIRLPDVQRDETGLSFFLHVAETGLVLLLFTDASRTDLRVLNRIRNLPVRLLSTGMLLTILLGLLAAKLVFPHISVWEAGILAAILAPTDAGLGQIIVNSPRVPMKIRQALNIEAGFNDGLSVPFLLFFIGLAAGGDEAGHASLTQFIVEQLGYGVLVGAITGLAGGGLLGLAHRREWMTHGSRQLGVVVLPLLCMLVSVDVGASMFIAAFVAGLTVQVGHKEAARHSVEFTEDWGQLFNLAVFFMFGMMVAVSWTQFDWTHTLYAVLSLTVIRMGPVAVALLGTGLNRVTVLFMGWFGPRGLASIVLGLVYLEEATPAGSEPVIRLTVMVTVLISIFAHGLSALPGMELYARKLAKLPSNAPDLDPQPRP
jgi:NhaP-type Na+/H+ or K+/H+ antiporter